MSGVARSVGCKQGIWVPFGNDGVEIHRGGAPDDLKTPAQLTQDVVLDAAVQSGESREGVFIVVLRSRVEQYRIGPSH